jgi:cytosine/adenosine deaminase-related metal-dependent hydrolase
VEALLSGTGMVWEHYYFGDMLVEGLQDVGLCGAVASTLQDIDGPGKDRTEQAWEETFSLHQNPAAAAQGIVAAIGPHATDTVSDELWTKIARTADEHNLPIHSHLAQALDEVEWSWNNHELSPLGRMQRLGLTDLEVNKLWVHALYVGDDELKMLNPKFDRLGHCPAAQMQFGFPAHTNAWRNQGFDVLLGTDSPSCNDSINVQAELRLFGAADAYGVTMGETLRKFRQDPILKKARAVKNERQIIYDMRAPFVSPENLLSALWNHPADLHPQAPVGMIEDGRWANLLVWDTNHPCFWPNTDPLQALTMANVTPGLKRIMTRGDWKFDGDGYLAHRVAIDPMVNLWRVEASERLGHLWNRAGL